MTIRSATKQDAPAVLDITKRAFEVYRQSLSSNAPLAALSETLPQTEADIIGGRVFVAADGNKIIGSIRYELLSPKLAYIYRFGVDPETSIGGAGSDLISHCLGQIKAAGCKAACLHTNSRYFKLARYYYGKEFYVHSTDNSKGYIRALFVKQFDPTYDADVTPAFKK